MKLGWKTITGTVLAAVAYVAQHGVNVESLVGGVGILLAGIGVRHAIAKAGE